jgi:tetratricopeptide (TPR) repeat protein
LAISERVLGSEHRYTAAAMGNVANVLIDEGHLAEGEKLTREALAVQVRTLGPDHSLILIGQLNLALVLLKEGRLHDAERLQRETLVSEIRVHGPEHPDTLWTQADLTATLLQERRYAEAETLARKTFDIQRRTLGLYHPDTLDTLQHLGTAMAYRHHYAEASQLFHDVIEKDNNSTRQGNPWSAWLHFACMAAVAKHSDDAVQYLREAVRLEFQDVDLLMTDDDLRNLRSYPRFQELVAELKRPASRRQPE